MLSQAALFERILGLGWLIALLPLAAAPWLIVFFRAALRQLAAFPRG